MTGLARINIITLHYIILNIQNKTEQNKTQYILNTSYNDKSSLELLLILYL